MLHKSPATQRKHISLFHYCCIGFCNSIILAHSICGENQKKWGIIMDNTTKETAGFSIIAPLSGEIIPLEQVPDPVFSDKVLGDGAAILPKDGKIYSPVNGTLATIAATKHAFGFQTDDGLEILVHVGLETVSLNGEVFTVHKQEGDSVKV